MVYGSFNKKRKRKVKPRAYFPVYWVLYGALLICFTVLLNWGLGWLTRYLTAFENSQPIHRAEEIYEKYFSGDSYVEALQKANFQTGKYESLSAVSQYLSALKGDREVSYYSISTGEGEAKYNFVFIDPEDARRDENRDTEDKSAAIQGVPSTKIATVRFVRSETADEFGFYGYELADMEMFATPTESFRVTLPSSSKLYCNGVEVSAECRVAEEAHPFNQFLPAGQNVEGITMVTYEGSGLYLTPTLFATDRDALAQQLEWDEESRGYEAKLNYSTALKESQAQRMMTGMQEFAKHMQNDVAFAAVKPYFDHSSEFYKGILENLSQFVWDHDGYEFQNQYIDEFYEFDENTFCFHISFDHVLKLRGREDYVDRLDMIVFARKIGNEYYIYDRWVQ